MSDEPHIKDKIGAHLSYPSTFTELQPLPIPQGAEAPPEVWFWAWKAPRKNGSRERYAILEARFSPLPSPGRWQLFVLPIPRPLRATVHSLIPDALAAIRHWFAASHPLIWYSSGHALLFDFVPETQPLVPREFNPA